MSAQKINPRERQPTMVAIRNLIYETCMDWGRELTLGVDENERPNVREGSRQITAVGGKVNVTTIQRIMNLERNADQSGAGLQDYNPTPALREGLRLWLELDSDLELIQAWLDAPEAPSVQPKDRRTLADRRRKLLK